MLDTNFQDLSRPNHLEIPELLVGKGLDGTRVDYPLLVSEALGNGVLRVNSLREYNSGTVGQTRASSELCSLACAINIGKQ